MLDTRLAKATKDLLLRKGRTALAVFGLAIGLWGVTTVVPGSAVTYTLTASNAGPVAVTGATVADTLPASLSGVTWTCVGSAGGTCTASGSGNLNELVNLPVGAAVTFTITGALSASATGTLSNTATITAPGGVTDPNAANNTATDTDTISAVPVASTRPASMAISHSKRSASSM